MYLTRIELDVSRRETAQALLSPSKIHGAIENGFHGERTRRLWRIDYLQDSCYLLVLSEDTPDFTELAAQFGKKELWETKCCDALAERIAAGQVWQFRLCANPVRSDPSVKGQRGKLHAHVTQDQQKKWLCDRAERCGFTLSEDYFDVVDTRWFKFKKGEKGEVCLRTATFEGTLTVADAERFRETLFCGIGREKAYGCGLLTIASPKPKNV